MRQSRAFQKGISLSDGILYGLIIAVVLLGGFAIFRSVDAQQRVATVFKGWDEDSKGYDKAIADSKTAQKPMLVYIYAPWCPHCKEFSKSVLTDDRIKAYIAQFPHVRVAPDHGEPEKKIMAEFGAEGYPSFYVVRPDGKRISVDTFVLKPEPRQKTPAEFLQSLKQVIGS
jgi:thiol:disulfide interchange protein